MNTNFRKALEAVASYPWMDAGVAALEASMATDGGHDEAHILRVMLNAHRIWQGEGEEADWELIAAAVLLHDSVNLPKDHPERSSASARSAELARRVLDPWFEPVRLDRIASAIAEHSYSSGRSPTSAEAEIVCDADRLEAIGAIGIARTFYVSGSLDRGIADLADPFARDRELNGARFGVDHFFEKLLNVAAGMKTKTGRSIAGERHARLVRYLHELAEELGRPADELNSMLETGEGGR